MSLQLLEIGRNYAEPELARMLLYTDTMSLTKRSLTLLISCLVLSTACAMEEDGETNGNAFDSDVPADLEKADEQAALTGFIVVDENGELPTGIVSVFDVDGNKLSEIDVDEYRDLAANGDGSLFASPVFAPADGRELDPESDTASFWAGPKKDGDTDTNQPGDSEIIVKAELRPLHCYQSGELRPRYWLPPCNGSARWVTPRRNRVLRPANVEPQRFAYLLYQMEGRTGDAEYPHAERTWWGWGGTVEVHKSAFLWEKSDGKYKRTEITVPSGSRFEYDEDRLIRVNGFEEEGNVITPIFLKLPLVFTN